MESKSSEHKRKRDTSPAIEESVKIEINDFETEESNEDEIVFEESSSSSSISEDTDYQSETDFFVYDPNTINDVTLDPLLSNNENSILNTPNISKNYDEDWVDNITEIPTFLFDSNRPGVKIPIEDSTPPNIFNKIITDDILDDFVQCTNVFGISLCNSIKPSSKQSRMSKFKEVTREEIQKFLGLVFLQGHVKIPIQQKIFSHDDPLYYHPVFSHVMSGRRFKQIESCFCIPGCDTTDLEAVTRFIDRITEKFRNALYPNKNLMLLKPFSKSEYINFNKPGRRSIAELSKKLIESEQELGESESQESYKDSTRRKVAFYTLSTCDGYVLNMKLKEVNGCINQTNKSTSCYGKIEKLVLSLMQPYLLKGHHLFMDRYYNSVNLCHKLLALKTHTTGPLTFDKEHLPTDFNVQLKNGEYFWLRNSNIYVSKWCNNESVFTVTTRNHPKLLVQSNKKNIHFRQPLELVTYQKYANKNNRANQSLRLYSLTRRVEWSKKVLFHLLDIVLWNCYYLYKNVNNETCKYVTYREEVIRELIKLDKSLKGKDIVQNIQKYFDPVHEHNDVAQSSGSQMGHWPVKTLAPATNKKKYSFLPCKVCAQKKVRRETMYRCKGCTSLPALCPSCFQEWHEKYVT